MQEFVKDILAEVVDVLRSRSSDQGSRGPPLPVRAHDFPNDLEPVIRADSTITKMGMPMPKYGPWNK